MNAEKGAAARKRYSTSVDTKNLPKNVKKVVKNEKTNETISIPPIRDLDALQETTGYTLLCPHPLPCLIKCQFRPG